MLSACRIFQCRMQICSNSDFPWVAAAHYISLHPPWKASERTTCSCVWLYSGWNFPIYSCGAQRGALSCFVCCLFGILYSASYRAGWHLIKCYAAFISRVFKSPGTIRVGLNQKTRLCFRWSRLQKWIYSIYSNHLQPAVAQLAALNDAVAVLTRGEREFNSMQLLFLD
jgi:hypothetical protein